MRVDGGVATRLLARRRQPRPGSSLAAGTRARRRSAPSRSTRTRSPRRPAGAARGRELSWARGRADAVRARRRRRPRRVLPPLPPRPAARPAAAPAAAPPTSPSPLALGGACLGDRQAADRESVARHRSSAASSAAGARASARADGAPRRPGAETDRRPGAGRTGVDGAVRGPVDRAAARWPATSPPAAAIPASRSPTARLLRGPGDRPLDRPVPGPLRPRRSRLAAGRRPDLHQAGRPARRSRPSRDRRGGRGVLRAVRAIPRPRRVLADRRLRSSYQASIQASGHQAGGLDNADTQINGS